MEKKKTTKKNWQTIIDDFQLSLKECPDSVVLIYKDKDNVITKIGGNVSNSIELLDYILEEKVIQQAIKTLINKNSKSLVNYMLKDLLKDLVKSIDKSIKEDDIEEMLEEDEEEDD